jgi:hypothetical protein
LAFWTEQAGMAIGAITNSPREMGMVGTMRSECYENLRTFPAQIAVALGAVDR